MPTGLDGDDADSDDEDDVLHRHHEQWLLCIHKYAMLLGKAVAASLQDTGHGTVQSTSWCSLRTKKILAHA